MEVADSSPVASANNSRIAFALLIIAFIIHNVEEAIFICRYPVQSPVSFIHPASCSQFLWAVSIISLAVIVAYAGARRSKDQTVYLFISTAVSAGLFINSLIPHALIAAYTRYYTPGLVSALLLILPLSINVLKKNRNAVANTRLFVKHLFLGIVIGYLFFAVTMGLSLYFF
jgi:hypothetical protein